MGTRCLNSWLREDYPEWDMLTLMPQFLWKSQVDENKQWGKEAITLVDFEASPLKNIYISHSPASETSNSWECLCFLILLLTNINISK